MVVVVYPGFDEVEGFCWTQLASASCRVVAVVVVVVVVVVAVVVFVVDVVTSSLYLVVT